VLVPGGKLFISVPDLDILATLILDKSKLSLDERFFVMRMIFGGHLDKYDYHVSRLNAEFLTAFLNAAGYVNVRRVQEFGLFNDASSMLFKGTAISLNMIAEKRGTSLSNVDSTRTIVGRNQPCPCGSGMRYKHCHGKAI
jgi:predicted SAM-dependent methyltransferase